MFFHIVYMCKLQALFSPSDLTFTQQDRSLNKLIFIRHFHSEWGIVSPRFTVEIPDSRWDACLSLLFTNILIQWNIVPFNCDNLRNFLRHQFTIYNANSNYLFIHQISLWNSLPTKSVLCGTPETHNFIKL